MENKSSTPLTVHEKSTCASPVSASEVQGQVHILAHWLTAWVCGVMLIFFVLFFVCFPWRLTLHCFTRLVLQPKCSCSRVYSSLFSFTIFTCFLVWSCTGGCLESEFGLIDWYNSLQHFVPSTPTCGTSFLFSCGKKTEKDKLTALLCCWDTTSHW